jgi:hypothetical protein
MNPPTRSGVNLKLWVGIVVLVVVTILGCVQWREFASPPPPTVTSEWRALIDDIRAFERAIGFTETKNFTSLTGERESFPFCGQASHYTLPYSYEDPAIRWIQAADEEQCHAESTDKDVYYGTVEVMGEIGTPVTPAMIGGKLDRFIYLVIHEDCHDQFDLPYGIEEALCDVITYHAMERFSKQMFRWYSRENRAIKSYSRAQSKQTRATIQHYAQLEALYARYQRAEVSSDSLLSGRAQVFTSAERALELNKGTLNNIVLANLMTYSRHYPYLEKVFETLGRDLKQTVEFFRLVDRNKPSKTEVLKRHGISAEKSVEFVRAYENAVIQSVEKTLAEWRGPRP